MNTNNDLSGKLALDANGLNNLKQAAKENSPEAIKGVAKQFEAIFMNMMLKSMREASPQDSPFDSEQSRQFTSMLDQQLSSNLASKGLGLADVLAKQLSKTGNIPMPEAGADEHAVSKNQALPNRPDLNSRPELTRLDFNNTSTNLEQQLETIKAVTTANPESQEYQDALNAPANDVLDEAEQRMQQIIAKALQNVRETEQANGQVNGLAAESASALSDPTLFKKKMAPHVEEASRASGIPAEYMLGQAALESGWGKHEIKTSDGSSSHNLFGIKATSNWSGKVVESLTTEYINGVKQKRVEKFRAYDSYADSFKDFASMMRSNPRYDKVMDNLHNPKDYAKAIQTAGYATDPHYANKLHQVIQKIAGNHDEA
jgi:peptidoglycan hydrolase FlgJ